MTNGDRLTKIRSKHSFPDAGWNGRRLGTGRLSGLTFAVKDLYDVAGA